MGNFLKHVNSLGEVPHSVTALTNLSLSKIKELHGSFKSVCDNFAMNLTEYEYIFGGNEAAFAIWDTDNNGIIESLELFTGLIVHADSKAEDKFRFLFDLFDFNEIQSLSAMDLEFAVQCAVIASCKIHNIQYDLNEIEIRTLVRKTFNDNVRVTLPQLLKWASLTDEIKAYYTYFNLPGPEMIGIQTLSMSELITYDKFQAQLTAADNEQREQGDLKKPLVPLDGSGRFFGKPACQLISNKRSLYFRAWLTTALIPLINYRLEAKQLASYTRVPDELKVKLEWVYGIRSSDTRKALQYTVGSLMADSVGARDKFEKQTEKNNEEIVYFIASVVVLLNTNVNKQRFYLSHDQEVISVAISTLDGEYIASGELAINPAIHIWSRKSLESLAVIKGLHSQGVHLLQFTNDNKFLVTCGLTNPSAVIIYDWITSEVVISTSIHAPTQEIFTLQDIKKSQDEMLDQNEEEDNARSMRPKSGVVVISLREIVIFTVTDGTFSQSSLPFESISADEKQVSPPICGMAIIANFRNQYFDALNIELDGERHLFLTGHKDGKVHLWRSDAYIGMLTDYKDEVTCMTRCFEGIAICTWRGIINLWDSKLSVCTKSIELSQLPFQLLSYNIQGIDYCQNRLLVLTLEGDVIHITLPESGSAKSNVIKAKRINVVTKISGAHKALSILQQDKATAVIGGDDGLITSYDIETHELIDVWAVGAKITAIATFGLEEGGHIIAAGTFNGNLIIRQDWEEIYPRYHQCGSKVINDLQFSKNGLLLAGASSDKHIYLFQYQDNDYQKLQAVKLENGYPISVNFSYDSRKIVVCTNQKKLILLDPQTFILMFKPEDLSHQFWSHFIGRYPHETKTQTSGGLIPMALGHKSNIVVAGDENGNVYLWRDSDSVRDHIGVNLTGHSSSLQRIALTEDDKRILSMGHNDQCLFQWKVTHVEQKDKDVVLKNLSQQENKISLDDESLINELNFCFIHADEEDSVPKEQAVVDNGILIRGCNDPNINKLNAKLNFEYEEQTWKRPPAMALVLDHIYGVQTSDRRMTVIYMHFHDEKAPVKNVSLIDTKDQSLHKSKMNQSRLDKSTTQQPQQPQQQSIVYDATHDQCHKHLVYFTSRFGILFSPFKNLQSFYQGHSLKISTIQKHPFRKLLATGEVSIKPSIHIWDANTLEPIMVLQSAHQGGVLHLAFSPDGKKLVSIGMDNCYSIQVFQWEQNRTLAFRNLGYLPIFGVKFYPFENSRFITCGYEHMAIWRMQGNHLTCLIFQKFECKKIQNNERMHSVLMSVDFLNYKLGNSIQSDILFGTSQGEIATYCSGKLFVLNDTAHKGSVNCIRVSDKLASVVTIITGGEDGLIKIWDTSMTLIQSIDIRNSAKVLKDLKNQRCYGIQSIEMYCCDKQHPRRLLVGLRCGEILEAIVSEKDNRAEQDIQKKLNQQIGKQVLPNTVLEFEFYTYVSAHSSLNISRNQKKVSCVVMPSYQVLASVGDDETLRFWDLIKKQIIVSKYLGAQATALAFSPDGAYLVVGLINGVLLVLEAKIQKLNFGSYMEEYSMPSLDVKMSPKEAKAAVICIRFSFRGDYLAVSYNNEHRDDGKGKVDLKAAEVGAVEPSFVMIYVNRISNKNPDNLKTHGSEPYVKLNKIVLPLGDFSASKVLRHQLAVTAFDFSDDEQFLQMCVQKINKEAVIETQTYNPQDNVFVLWDIQNDTMVTNFEHLKSTKWPDWSMAPSINSRFHGTEINLEDPIEERQLLFKELNHMSRIARFTLMDNAICGSHLGGLYLFRFQALTVEKLKVADFRFDLIRKKDMAATRCFSGHTSMIQSIEILDNKTVLSTSVSDQCIVQWRVDYEDQHWELDFNNYIADSQDPYNEFLSRAKFDKLVNEQWTTRLQVSEVNQGVSREEYQDPACEMELQNIIGRRAYDRRGNIKIDCMDRISYQASSLQVFLTDNDNDNVKAGNTSDIKQVFLRPDGNAFKTKSSELSCFCMSKDLRILFTATAEIEANVYIWEVTTNMKLGEFKVPKVPIITNIKVAHDSKQVLFLGITKEYYQMISMVDWTKGNKVLFTRQFLHSLTFRIRDIEFMPDSTRTFVTAGIQHLCFWRLSGSNLEYQVAELTIPKNFASIGAVAYCHNPANQGKFGLTLVTDELQQQMFLKPNAKQEDDLENLFVTFLNIIFIGGTLITSGDDGYLYLWDRERVVKRILAHEGAIFALNANSKLGTVVSGGMEGLVTLWRLLVEQKTNVKSLERLRICNMRKNMDPHQAVLTPECNVQSVCLGHNRIIVGMRTGTIQEVTIKVDPGVQKTDTRVWIKCADHEAPKSVGIDLQSNRIYTITANGLFSVWDLKTFDVKFSKNFARKTRHLYAWRLSHKVMLIFSHEIIVCDSDPMVNKFEEKADYSLFLNQITFATLNQNEQILGVATISASAPEVTLYSTDGGGFMKLKQIFGFKSSISFLDFSTDNGYMQVEDKVGEVTLYEIETDRPIKTDAIDFDLEWLGEGLRTYSRLKGLRNQYNQQNTIVKIKKLLGKPVVVVADQMGTIRLFNYPNVKGQPYYQSYSDHLFKISDCMFSPDKQFFVTSCHFDRCIFKWKVKTNEAKIQRMIEDDLNKLNEMQIGKDKSVQQRRR